MVLPGAVPGPGTMNPQSRSYSEQPGSEGLAVDEVISSRCGKPALHEEKPSLKRACSFPAAVYHQSSNPSTSSTSTKPSFKIQLPSIDLSKLSAAFLRHQKSSETVPTSPPQAPSAGNVLDSPVVEDHPIHTNFPPLFTPPDERPAVTDAMSTSNSEQVPQLQESSTSEAEKITNPKGAPEGVKAAMQSGEGRGQSAPSKDVATSGGAEGSRDHRAQGNVDKDNSNAHWLDATLEAAGSWRSQLGPFISSMILIYGTVSELVEEPDTPQLVIKVVAQTLPSIVADGTSETSTTAFLSLICALQNKLSTTTPYFQVHHIVPPSFSLTSLPTSPPSTPSVNVSVIPQTDYFSPNIFSSAVAVIDRHNKYSKPASGPSSPFAVVPNTADFSLYERFIPPSTVQEFKDLFLTTGQSALVDRLGELSPNNGTLLFIYPTKAGATTFKTKHLNPILDPVLRSVITSHCLSTDIGVKIGTMAAADHLLTFEAMTRKMQALLRGLGRDSRRFALVHAKKAIVHMERKVWSDWFVKQETPRIRNITTEYINRAVRLPQEEHISYAVLTREIVEGVRRREYAEGEEPGLDSGIEVGVFVVRRGD